MITTSAQQIAGACGGRLVQGSPETTTTAVSTDTRSISKGDLFVALAGENFDAHNFLPQAVDAGAAILLVSQKVDYPADVAVILCDDTLQGLQDLASWHRQQHPLPVVGITGSNGKTSTKDFTRSVLSQRFRVNATFGNLNNHIGLPLSVLKTTADHDCCVLEMGMNHPGEIAPLCEICSPDIGIITNVGTAHIEHMGSRDAIALEKGALARALTSEGTLILAAGGDYNKQLADSSAAKTIIAGKGDIRAEDVCTAGAQAKFTLVIGDDSASVTLPVTGQHMVANALLAAATGQQMGLTISEIATGLTSTELTSGRMRAFNHGGIAVFDDTYNANPDSVAAALETLSQMSFSPTAKRYAVLGKMAELGDHRIAAYQRIGELAATLGLQLIVVGDDAEPMHDFATAAGCASRYFATTDDAAAHLRASVAVGDAVLFKGSRLAGMERVLAAVFPEN